MEECKSLQTELKKSTFYNYELGPNIKDIKLYLIPFLLLTICKKIINIQSASLSFYELLLALLLIFYHLLNALIQLNLIKNIIKFILLESQELFEFVEKITIMIIVHSEQISQKGILQMKQQIYKAVLINKKSHYHYRNNKSLMIIILIQMNNLNYLTHRVLINHFNQLLLGNDYQQ